MYNRYRANFCSLAAFTLVIAAGSLLVVPYAMSYAAGGAMCDLTPRLSPSPSSVERPSRLICAVPCDCAGMWMFERCYRQQADVLYKHELIIVTSGTFERKKGLSIQR